MKVSLTTMTKYIGAVISLKDISVKKIEIIMQDLEKWCQQTCESYSFILHDKDTLDSGELKTKHIHLVATLLSRKKRLSTTIHDIGEFIGVNDTAISIEKVGDMNGAIRYLCHKDSPSKYQYDKDLIKSNYTKGEIDIFMNSELGFSLEYLEQSIINNKGNKRLIMKDIGLSYYHNYRNEIKDLIEAYELGEYGLPF